MYAYACYKPARVHRIMYKNRTLQSQSNRGKKKHHTHTRSMWTYRVLNEATLSKTFNLTNRVTLALAGLDRVRWKNKSTPLLAKAG